MLAIAGYVRPEWGSIKKNKKIKLSLHYQLLEKPHVPQMTCHQVPEETWPKSEKGENVQEQEQTMECAIPR